MGDQPFNRTSFRSTESYWHRYALRWQIQSHALKVEAPEEVTHKEIGESLDPALLMRTRGF